MSKWIDFSKDERKSMIQGVVSAKGIDETAVEKDWWVTAVLYALFRTNVAKYLLFKGGTSLSKGWNIIDRFSEDIDLVLSRDFFLNERMSQCAKCENKTQIHNFREEVQDYIFGTFKKDLEGQLANLGLDVQVLTENEDLVEKGESKKVAHDKDPSVIFVKYQSLYVNEEPYAMPTVKIEISALSMTEPYEEKRISSLIEQVYNEDVDSDFVQTVKVVSPARTFLEKAFLLCEEYQKETPRTFRMSRHFYDLEKLYHNSVYGRKALENSSLYYEIVEHRKKFYNVGYVDYDMELPLFITIVPSDVLIPKYKEDYERMRTSFIYGDSMEFSDMINFLEELQAQFRKIPPR